MVVGDISYSIVMALVQCLSRENNAGISVVGNSEDAHVLQQSRSDVADWSC
jgi:chemotaxis methyl-accepting protein methylase